MIFYFLIIACVVCAACCFLIIFYTNKKYKQITAQRKVKEKDLDYFSEKLNEVGNQLGQAKEEKYNIEKEIETLSKSAEIIKKQADEMANAYYDQKMQAIELQLNQDLKFTEEKFQQAKEEYQKDYEDMMADMAKTAADYGNAAQQLIITIEDLRSKARAAIDEKKRKWEEHDIIEFHKIQIPDSDLLEIEKLREILPYLRDKDTLNKVIYKIYYENPVNDLIGRVVGKKQGGIYKITNINNGMCYVGQAVNFSNRWKQHIKRGVGAEPITHNKLYPAMQKEGVENFTFEIIEECPQNKLNEREQYWQDYFGAKEFGYSIR